MIIITSENATSSSPALRVGGRLTIIDDGIYNTNPPFNPQDAKTNYIKESWRTISLSFNGEDRGYANDAASLMSLVRLR